MNNPYSVLGVSQDASMDEIKNAYRELARKYHPDNYEENPLKDLAEEKMAEINAAYDQIIAQRNANGQQQTTGEFSEIEALIHAGQYEQAQLQLDQIPISQRNARWYYLSGNVQYSRGWYDDAFTNYATAHRMDPSNPEYRGAVEHMNRRHNGGGYRTRTHHNGGNSCSSCDVCSSLICADCCCECMGGDLISCC